MKIFLVEPFFSGSHQRWAEGLQSHSQHDIKILSLPGRHWKWRMYGGAVALAAQYNQLKEQPDLILATDMLDLTTFLALTKQGSANIPTAIYFHENQITYPWSPDDADIALGRNNQYGFINYTSALVADYLFFNSNFHRNSFLGALPAFLGQFPDHKGLDNMEALKNKSSVLPLGMDLQRFDKYKTVKKNNVPTLLWNHRWEYDKNPNLFFDSLFKLKSNGHNFNLIILGESYKKSPLVFKKAEKELTGNLLHFGYADSFEKYASLVCQTDFIPVTSRQDFFGGSVVEAIYCNCFPILPKRLAFPEHLPKEIQDNHFYNQEKDFYAALETSVINWSSSKHFTGEQFVKKYDWNNSIGKYDHAFNRVF